MDPSLLVTKITAAAVALAENKSVDDLNMMSAVLTQFADTLLTIATQRDIFQKQAAQKTDDDANTESPKNEKQTVNEKNKAFSDQKENADDENESAKELKTACKDDKKACSAD